MSVLLGGLIFYLFINNLAPGDQTTDKTLGDALQMSSETLPLLQSIKEDDLGSDSTTNVSLLAF